MSIIKNSKLLAKRPEKPKKKHTIYTLKNKKGQRQTYLGDVFKELPCGLIYKHETGMGATHLEIQAPRNSIIVEPLKIIATSKHHKSNGSIYVGSESEGIPNPIVNDQIREYVQNSKIKYKKILVVADSLGRVINAIGSDVYKDYFLLIDEADSFQMDVGYRPKMNICVDYYKKFTPTKRAMISATFMGFSDPKLKSEAFTEFKYEMPIKRTINLIHYTTVIQMLYDDPISLLLLKIQEIHSKHPTDKIYVAYNYLGGCKAIAERVYGTTGVSPNEVKILCSSRNKPEVGSFYGEPSDGLLPGKINLCTSAYFSGFDIDEPYHLISFSNIHSLIFTLSDKRLKQIAGRARNGLLSETIFYNVRMGSPDEKKITIEDVLEAATFQLEALKCVQKHFSKSNLLRENLNRFKELLTEADEESTMNFIYIDIDGNPQISYLNVDAYFELLRVRSELYAESDTFKDLIIEQGHDITVENFHTDGTIIHGEDTYEARKIREVNEIINHLSTLTDLDDVHRSVRSMKLSDAQKTICNIYADFRGYVDNVQLLKGLQKKAMQDKRAMKNFILMNFVRLLPPDDHFKVLFNAEIKQGGSYTTEELREKWNSIDASLGLELNAKTDTTAIRYINLVFDIGRADKNGKHKIQPLKDTEDTLEIKKPFPKGRDYPKELQALLSGI